MRVHANRDSALVLAAQASKAVPKITTIPELKGIHMEADARLAMLTMTATNQEVSIRASMPAAVEESGSAVIPADLLPDILKRLPGDQVSFSTVGPGIIHIGSGYAEYRLNILDAAKYPLPEVPFLEDTIPVSGICSLARQTLFAAAAGDQQNILKTVRLKVGPYGLKATSSNGFCIAEAAGDKNCVAASETCILVPARSLSILAAISLDSDVYQMGLTREGLAFWNGTTMFCTHLIDGSYPDTDGLLDRIQGAYSASIEAAELYAAVDTVTSLASADKDSSGRGEIMFGEHEMVVSAETSDGRASVPVKALILSPSPYPFYYDFKQLMRYLKQLRGRITLEFDQNGLLAIRPGETRYWYMEQDDLTLGAKNAQFLKLFHAEDQGVVEDWISRCHAEEPYTAPRRDRKSALLYAVLERARACGDLREIEPILDYYLPTEQEPLSSDMDSYLTNYQFSAIANISYGCEGIFVDLAIEGNFDDSGTNRCTIGTFKTLRQDNDAGRLMGQLCGILMYHTTRYVNENLHRYTPKRELEAELRRMQACGGQKEGTA